MKRQSPMPEGLEELAIRARVRAVAPAVGREA